MNLNEFDYNLPESAVAQKPLLDRTDSRLLIDIENQIHHSKVCNFPEIIKPGDLIVMNNTRVLPARFQTYKSTGGKVEILLLEESEDEHQWEALVKPSRKIDTGTIFKFGEDFEIEVLDDLGKGLRKVQLNVKGEFIQTIEKYGEMPLPPYIKTKLDDKERYQTVYSEKPKSAAAPTAGLHLSLIHI